MGTILLAAAVWLTATVSAQQATEEAISEITSEGSIYDQKEGVLRYWGNVHLDSPGTLDLRCEHFVIHFGANSNRLDQIVATTNVVLRLVQVQTNAAAGGVITNVAFAHQAIFDGVSNIVTLLKSPTGVQPRFERADLVAEADTIIYNRDSDRFELKGNHRTRFKPGKLPKGVFFGPTTNAPKAKPAP